MLGSSSPLPVASTSCRCYSLRGSGKVKLHVNHFFSSFELLIQPLPELLSTGRGGVAGSFRVATQCHYFSSNIAKCAQSGTLLEQPRKPSDSLPHGQVIRPLKDPWITRFKGANITLRRRPSRRKSTVNPIFEISSRPDRSRRYFTRFLLPCSFLFVFFST